MTPEEFREAYLEAQNGLGNSLQVLASLSRSFTELAGRFNVTVESVQSNYVRMNSVVEEFLNDQENQS